MDRVGEKRRAEAHIQRRIESLPQQYHGQLLTPVTRLEQRLNIGPVANNISELPFPLFLFTWHCHIDWAQTNVEFHSVCLRKQVPLRASAAKTSHKTQGSTYEITIGDFSVERRKQTEAMKKAKKKKQTDHLPRPVKAHMFYVVCSRVTSLNGLFLIGFGEDVIHVAPPVAVAMERLR